MCVYVCSLYFILSISIIQLSDIDDKWITCIDDNYEKHIDFDYEHDLAKSPNNQQAKSMDFSFSIFPLVMYDLRDEDSHDDDDDDDELTKNDLWGHDDHVHADGCYRWTKSNCLDIVKTQNKI